MGKSRKDREISKNKKSKKKYRKQKKSSKKRSRSYSKSRSRSRSLDKNSLHRTISKYPPKNFEELRAGILEYLNSSLMTYPINISRFYTDYINNYIKIPNAKIIMDGLEIEDVLKYIKDK